MHKNALFFLKNPGKSPQTPDGLRRLGAPPSDPRVVTPITWYIVILLKAFGELTL